MNKSLTRKKQSQRPLITIMMLHWYPKTRLSFPPATLKELCFFYCQRETVQMSSCVSWLNPSFAIRVHSWFWIIPLFSCLSCFSWLNPSFAIRVHSWFFLSPLLIFVPFVLFVVKYFFCYSCLFVSIRGSDFSHYFHAFRGLIIRIHSWFVIPVRPVLRRH